MKVLGINAIYHDPSAALVVDGVVVAAAEEERFSRRKHGKRPLPWSAWELPELAAAWCLREAGIRPEELDAVAYSFDPELMGTPEESGLFDDGDVMRKKYAEMAPDFLAHALPGLDPAKVRFVKHHVAHAASAGLAAPARAGLRDNSVLVLDGRGEAHSHLAGRYRDGQLEVLAGQALPHSLGLMYEDLTDHLGFLRSSDEFKVMAMASYGKPRFVGALSEFIRATDDGGFRTDKVDYSEFAPRLGSGEQWTEAHADLAASVQQRLEEVLIDLATWVHAQTGDEVLTLAGGTALNCVANTRILAESPFEQVWVQPAAGDAGTALGAALHVARELGEETQPMPGAALGRGWTDEQIEQVLITASIDYERPDDVAEAVAEVLADNGIVAWFQGRSEFGPRALGRRSLMAHPGFEGNLERMNDVKGREQFRPVAPMVLLEKAPEIFSRGPIPSPYMLFVHDVAPEWREKIPTVTHVDGTARIQTIDPEVDPLVHRMISAFERRTGLPIVVNTSLNTAGRPMVDDPRDALECFGSAPVDLLAIGPFVVRRPKATPRPA
ncbi:carbamoyltransferase [Modestobacter sp. VKM Ac-2986]|uniref:carbamoyltransferase family protein n=1 Tax=Modestobacter sp. VKM Ac-2986 TaxID=3004140 RepID=UPI0022AA770D|nr:carbamoyltransferase C-terminal domain-containing protein [Modestobacter sp. VKM Ac-2986]MCZ2827511.1 carbamoyltransferase [Modestobacter sp. VKM Ac-2986]